MRTCRVTESGIFVRKSADGPEEELAVGMEFPIPDEGEIPAFMAGKCMIVGPVAPADAEFVAAVDPSKTAAPQASTADPSKGPAATADASKQASSDASKPAEKPTEKAADAAK